MKWIVHAIAVIFLSTSCCASTTKGNGMRLLQWLMVLAVIIPPMLQPCYYQSLGAEIRFNKKRLRFSPKSFLVVSPGIEPGTQGFSVLCSTD